jgi:hypothetical protein
MLSTFRSCAPQDGQRDLGETTDSPRGRRWMATVRKLPKKRPNGIEAATRIAVSKATAV